MEARNVCARVVVVRPRASQYNINVNARMIAAAK
jgi:hypothetical protein